MIEIQFAPIKNRPAILAGVLVPLENIVPGKLHFLFRQSIEEQQDDHARHTDLPRNRRDHFVLRRVHGKIAPAIEIVRQEIIRLIRRHDVGMSGINQRERASRRADVHRLPQPVQHQHLII